MTPVIEGNKFFNFNKRDIHFQRLQRIATLASDAEFVRDAEADKGVDVMSRETKGDAVDAAVIKYRLSRGFVGRTYPPTDFWSQ